MIASLPLSDPMVPEHDDFRKLLTATSELHKLDFRRQVRAPWRRDATRCDATRCDVMRRDATRRGPLRLLLCCVGLYPQWSQPHALLHNRTCVPLWPHCDTGERRAPRLPPRGGGAALAYRRQRSVGTHAYLTE